MKADEDKAYQLEKQIELNEEKAYSYARLWMLIPLTIWTTVFFALFAHTYSNGSLDRIMDLKGSKAGCFVNVQNEERVTDAELLSLDYQS